MSPETTTFRTKIRDRLDIFGILGSIILLGGSLVTALAYTGLADESYSWLNHFISELGQVSVSELAMVFNIGLILTGICYLFFMIGLGLYYQTKWGYVSMVTGVIASIFCTLVGIFPMDNLIAHSIVAFTFFYSGLIAMFFFSILILRDKRNLLPKWLTLPTLISLIAFTLFLFYPFDYSEMGNPLDTSGIVLFGFLAHFF